MNLKQTIESYIKDWESKCYYNGLPDEAPKEIFNLVPSYKRICIAILKNDNSLQSLGFEPKKSKYYSELKRIEIEARPTIAKQLKLNLQYKH
jgi:predicted phosphoadenosine phosphosulfate sulfurtransferase